MIAETPRLLIRALTSDDAEFVLRLTNEPSFLANIGDKGVRNLDDARRYLRESPWTNQKRPGYGQFVVEVKDEGTPIGICGLLYRDHLDVTDIGFAFLPEFWGRGLALEAAGAVIEYGRSKLGVGTVVGLTKASNLPSIRLLEKLGMRFLKTVKMSDEDPGTALYG
jgi:RimJ/RimL family protein N-acetyltransferase